MSFKLTLLPGDGIGPEVVGAAVKVMKHAAEKFGVTIETVERLIGGASYEEYKNPLTDETLQTCYDSDAVLLGAVGGYAWENLPHHLKPEAALLKLRKSLGLYANIRPAKVYDEFLESSSLKSEVLKGTDFVVFRELTGGIYFGQPRGIEADKGFNTMVYTTEEIERIARKAFEAAAHRGKKVTSIDKANVLEVSQFWRNVVERIAKDYPDIKLNHMYVDNAAMQIVRDPKQFDVVVTSNLFGDIISDIAGQITGSLGMLPSASLGDKYALYEPVHGSAPDIAGQNKANPIATILSVAMMFEYSLKMTKAATVIEEAVGRVLKDGYRTVDINTAGGKLVNTTDFAELVLQQFDEVCNEEALGVFTL